MAELAARADGGPPRVVVAGGGVAALEALLSLHQHLAGMVELTLVAPEADFVYRPLTTAAPFSDVPVPRLPLADVAAEHRARLVRASLAGVDVTGRVARLDDGSELPFEALIVAVGARPQPVLPGAVQLAGPADVPALTDLVARVRAGTARRVGLLVPEGVVWTLPLYELALQLGVERAPDGTSPQLVLVTAEPEPLAAFGAEAAAETRELLEARGVLVYTSATVEGYDDGTLWIEFEGGAAVDAVIALPRLRGPAIDGLPHDEEGFVPIDRSARVAGVDAHVYAAGDAVAFALKQGGLAAQQADAAAGQIAAALGAGAPPAPLELVLRGELLTGAAPRFLRTRVPLAGEERDPGQVSREPLWWPPGKIAARHLSPYLARRLAPADD